MTRVSSVSKLIGYGPRTSAIVLPNNSTLLPHYSKAMSNDLKLGNDFLRVPKLSADGKGFVVWKERLELSVRARGLYGHLDGTITRPVDPPSGEEASALTKEQVSAITETFAKELSTYLQEQAIVFQQIASTIPDSLYLKIKSKPTVKQAWDALKADFEKRSRMITIELRKRLQDVRCTENGNIRTHFDIVRTMREELVSLGTVLNDLDFSAIILGSLPKSYDQFLSAVTATASVMKQDLDPEDLMQTVVDEFDRRSTRSGGSKDKGQPDAAFYAGESGSRGGKKLNKDVECFNCHKKGHKKADCWGKGGGKEGQGPRSKERKTKGADAKEGSKGTEKKKESANAATGDEEGVWMAYLEDSGDEYMADTEFDDFTISDEELFYMEEEEEEREVKDITAYLKKVLKISESSQCPYDNPRSIFDATEDTDSSDDEGKAVAMQVESDSDEEPDIDPYWSKIVVDELQGLGNPCKIDDVEMSDTDSLPDLEDVSDTDTDMSEDSNHFITGPDALDVTSFVKGTCVNNGIKKGRAFFDCGNLMEMVKDNGEDGYSTFDAAMLVNVEGSAEGIQTELYDSGASRHMSPYRDHFENYVRIMPKAIAAADKRYFQAVGKGDLHIKIPTGSETTTVLLKDVLHCPDMGLTLVSIGKITAAGYKVIFRGPTCKIFDPRDKVIGNIIVKNGLYRVDHDISVNVAVAGEAREVLTVEELHRRMGHIAPEAAKRMVSSGAVEGVEIDHTSLIQTCESCEFAKMTRKPIKKTRDDPRASKFGDRIHSDLWGPSPVQTPGHKEYYVSFTDDCTRWTHLDLLVSKDKTFEAYKNFEAWAKLHFGIPAFKTLQSDRGGEYLGKEFSKHLASQGTMRKLTTHDTPEYNGISERLNRTLLERTRALLHASKLPKNLWGEAITHVVWLKNRTPTRALPDGKTPYKMLYNKRPNLGHLKEWGCKVWVHSMEGLKLDGRSKVGKWVGFDEPSNAHRIFWPEKCSITVERSVKFDDTDDVLVPFDTKQI